MMKKFNDKKSNPLQVQNSKNMKKLKKVVEEIKKYIRNSEFHLNSEKNIKIENFKFYGFLSNHLPSILFITI